MSAVSTMLSTPMSHKHEGSPRSLSTISTSSPASAKNHFSPNHSLLSQPNSSAAAATTNVNNSGYPVYGVSPPEASTASASGIISGGNGPTSTIDGNEIGLMRKENLDYMSQDLGTSSQFCSIPENQELLAPEVIVIKDPFDDDFDANSPIRNQLTNAELQQESINQWRASRQAMYPITDKMVLQRMPYAFNRPYVPPYPIPADYQNNPSAYINRSHAYPPHMPMHPGLLRFVSNQPGMMIPPGAITPGNCPPPQPQSMQAPPAKKSKSKSSKQNAQPSMPSQQMMRMPVDMNRGVPPGMHMQNPYHMQMMMQQMRMQSMDPKCRPMMVRPTSCAKFINNGTCAECNLPISTSAFGVICTANRQGCSGTYHFQCSRLEPAALNFLKYDEIEWICGQCSQTKQIHWG